MTRLFTILGDSGVQIGERCTIDPTARFGCLGPITVDDNVIIAAGTIVCGNSIIEEGVVVDEYVVVGKPERGYAMGTHYDGTRAGAILGQGAALRSGVRLYDGVRLGTGVAVGHSTVVRSNVSVGAE